MRRSGMQDGRARGGEMSDRPEPRRVSDGEGSFRASCRGKIERPSRRERELGRVSTAAERGAWGPVVGNRAEQAIEATFVRTCIGEEGGGWEGAEDGCHSGRWKWPRRCNGRGGRCKGHRTRQTRKRRGDSGAAENEIPPTVIPWRSRIRPGLGDALPRRDASWPIAGEWTQPAMPHGRPRQWGIPRAAVRELPCDHVGIRAVDSGKNCQSPALRGDEKGRGGGGGYLLRDEHTAH
ncbi:hypothetical protein THAOC_07005 [Thalassiosira oceanica]|uniref:Uncharacterized protein n=1 Tax=Thalassiosira oceanica TaxID=159749 RepID=K0T300_THAOC|nr:hypothetical protein THAOC_07005 [Thalassiosira oceanica]|eukprot:EJK71539.1 hypothetical protein THAOC_07005 [Thalassiosira oceanica]